VSSFNNIDSSQSEIFWITLTIMCQEITVQRHNKTDRIFFHYIEDINTCVYKYFRSVTYA